MSADDHGHPLDLQADPADQLMGLLVDAREAIDKLHHGFASAACPQCDPTGETAGRLGEQLAERYGTDAFDADFLLAQVADARAVLQGVLLVPCCEHHHEGDDEGGEPS